ncbi:MAG TPA: hypothetical protein VJZ27_14335, partial [Aggregatilineales bacterium]|nr:hypothetical protein [Aggregatilineales bacterium]
MNVFLQPANALAGDEIELMDGLKQICIITEKLHPYTGWFVRAQHAAPLHTGHLCDWIWSNPTD